MKLLMVDDEANLRRMLGRVLSDEGFQIAEASSAEEGLRLARESAPEVILLDLALPGMSGLDALPRFLELLPTVPVVMMSGEASLTDAVQATRQGAFHFLEKPLNPEAVLATLRGAVEVSRARDLSRVLREEMGPGTQLVGVSQAMEEVRSLIHKVAPTDARVLIAGESGTGKELAAAAIHGLSRRKGGPFVRVNSAAIPRELVESEMFGHEKGSFSGATERRRGRFELSHGGTLFLDEVGDLGMEAQAKLLRALESGVIQRVGGQNSLEVDVRVLAATNRDLHQAVQDGGFRKDLLFRLEVVVLRMPPLRDRPEDIPPLVEHVRGLLRGRQGLHLPAMSDDGLHFLQRHSWPGNVRELLNLLERVAILGGGERVDADLLRSLMGGSRRSEQLAGGSVQNASPGGASHLHVMGESGLATYLEYVERTVIQEALEVAGSNVAEAARLLQSDRANLYRKMKRLGMRSEE